MMHRSKLPGSTRFYGWQPSAPDRRDDDYRFVPRHGLTGLPAVVDLVTPALPGPFEPTWDQLALGSCGPNSFGEDIVFAGLRQQKLPAMPMPSRLFIYYVTRSLMGTLNQDSGVDNRTMLKAVAAAGWCDESLCPYDIAAFRNRPSDSAFTQALGRKITLYQPVEQSLDVMRACLAGGDTFIFGFSVYESFESAEVTRTGLVPMPGRRERQIGGHDVLMVGYDASRKLFKFRNSWGPDWGDHGCGYFPEEYVTNPRLSGDFWTVTHSAYAPTPTPPAPPAPPGPTPTTRIITVTGATSILVDGKPI